MRARLALAIVLASGGLAYAGDPASDAAALANQGDFVGAAAKFREAYAADPKPELMCNVGVAYYKAADYPHAFRYLDQCLAAGTSLDKTFLDAVRNVVAAVDTKLRAESFAPIDIAVEPATATTLVEYGGHAEEPIVGSRRVWVPYGHYKLTIHAEGFTDRVIEGDAGTHDAIAARAKLEPKAAGPVEVKSPPPTPTPTRPIEPPPARHNAVAGVVSGVALAGGGFGLAAFLLARSRASAAGAATDHGVYDDKVKAAHTWQHVSWVSTGIGGAAAIAAGYLWYRAFSTPAPVEVAPAAAGGATVSWSIHF